MSSKYEIAPNSTQLRLGEAAHEVFSSTLDSMTPHGLEVYEHRAFQNEGQPKGNYSNTFYHEIEVGALVLLATSCKMTAISAATHDTGKGVERVCNVMTLPRRLNAAEWITMSAHTSYGAHSLRGAFLDKEQETIARHTAALHHTPRPDFFVNTRERALWDHVTVTAVADRAQALLLDWRRSYKAERMKSEGLITSDGMLVMSKIAPEILGKEAGRTYMGARTNDILDLAVACMPSREFIQDSLARSATAAVAA